MGTIAKNKWEQHEWAEHTNRLVRCNIIQTDILGYYCDTTSHGTAKSGRNEPQIFTSIELAIVGAVVTNTKGANNGRLHLSWTAHRIKQRTYVSSS